MPYEPHASFNLPPLDAALWRYMNIEKFKSLLDQGLFFARADKLGDPFEGSIPMANGPQSPNVYRVGKREIVVPSLMPLLRKDLARFSLISCWHMSCTESEVMWRRYCDEHKGIAVRTDVASLRDCFVTDTKVWMGKVEYKSYKTEPINLQDVYLPFMTKRSSFRDEHEVRAIIDVEPPRENGEVQLAEDACEVGIPYAVDLTKLTKEIVVAPLASEEFVERIMLLVKQNGLNVSVHRSSTFATLTWGDPRDFPEQLTEFEDLGEILVDPHTKFVYSRFGKRLESGTTER